MRLKLALTLIALGGTFVAMSPANAGPAGAATFGATKVDTLNGGIVEKVYRRWYGQRRYAYRRHYYPRYSYYRPYYRPYYSYNSPYYYPNYGYRYYRRPGFSLYLNF